VAAKSGLIILPPKKDALEQAFPKADPGLKPLGHRVLVQIRSAKLKSDGGILQHTETKETEKWNTQVARVVELGPVAFCNRDTLKPWPEGAWCKVGDYVRVPKYGGDRWEVPLDEREEPALFVLFKDLDIIGQITGDPLAVVAFI
jgi:co-chaperonin GroES (HSP10)